MCDIVTGARVRTDMIPDLGGNGLRRSSMRLFSKTAGFQADST